MPVPHIFSNGVGFLSRQDLDDNFNAVQNYNALPSAFDSLSATQIAAIQAGTSTFNMTPIIQALIDTRKPFRLPVGTYRCNATLVAKAGMCIYGSMSAPLGGSGTDSGAVILQFDNALTSVGLDFNTEAGVYQNSMIIDGVTFDVVTPATAVVNFTHWRVSAPGLGIYDCTFRNLTIRSCQYGWDIGSSVFASLIDNMHFTNCYKAIRQTAGFLTSVSTAGWLKMSFCFHGIELTAATYCRIDSYYDNCGLTAPFVASWPALEMPIGYNLSNCANLTGSIGQENSNAMLMWAHNYSSCEFALHSFNSIASLWQSSAIRISNIAQAAQAWCKVETAFLKIMDWVEIATSGAGYPIASAVTPSFLFRCSTAGDPPRLILENCFLDKVSYCVAPSADLPNIYAPDAVNARMNFGALNISTLLNGFGIENARLRIGVPATSVQDYHQISRQAVFASGAECLRIIGGTGGSSVRFFAINGGAGNAANCAINIPADSGTSRSINAGGTMNANGTDYAEYEFKRSDCSDIEKGDIVGFDNHGLLTDRFSLAVSFAIKSTNPSFVGGDDWSEGRTDPTDLETARMKVDRIAYVGKVPCNVYDTRPGDWIEAIETADGRIGAKIVRHRIGWFYILMGWVNQDRVVGRVRSILPDGRAMVRI